VDRRIGAAIVPSVPRLCYEACVSSIAQARAAQHAGADRLELCARLATGGLTPPEPRLRAVRAAVSLPIHVMTRPRPGEFTATPDDVRAMVCSIRTARAAGADGIVVGVLRPDDSVDRSAMVPLLRAARGLSVTFHRAFDHVADPFAALELLIELGVDRVLTAGGARTARQGIPVLRQLVRAAGDRIGIIAAGKVRPANVQALTAATGVREVHAHLTDPAAMRALARRVGGA